MKIWLEQATGHSTPTNARTFPGFAHPFVDCTDRPSPSIVASRPIRMIVEHDEDQGNWDAISKYARVVALDDVSPTIMTHGRGMSQIVLDTSTQTKLASSKFPKPPYAVPSMAEIASLPWNGFNVVSTFSGCGGSCLGYRMAGFRVLWANEFIAEAQKTYKANHPASILDTRDIRKVKPEEILKATGLAAGELDLLDGSPPCASFSTAGKREEGWGKVKKYSDGEQRTDDLFFEYVRILRGLRPRTFVAENVSGLVKGSAKGYFLEILSELKKSGYRVVAKLLDAQWLGVPQARQRIIFVGVREDLNVEPAHPMPLSYRYTVRDALPWITTGATGVVEADTNIERFAIGAEWDKMGTPGTTSEKYRSLVRPALDKPSPTVTCPPNASFSPTAPSSSASVVHPTEKRKFSIAELRRICAFPDDFVLTGSYAQQWERLGRSVPPVMMRAIATAVRDKVLTGLPPGAGL